jgi:hypothetical protein
MSERDDTSGNMPDYFERLLGQFDGGLPGLTRTKPATIQTVPTLGVGGSVLIALQTYRQEGQLPDDELGDTKRQPARFTTFVRVVQGEKAQKFVLTDQVLATLRRQIDGLTAQAQAAAARRGAATRKARGFRPAGFPKKKKHGKGK